jgi:hypothetical protein
MALSARWATVHGPLRPPPLPTKRGRRGPRGREAQSLDRLVVSFGERRSSYPTLSRLLRFRQPDPCQSKRSMALLHFNSQHLARVTSALRSQASLRRRPGAGRGEACGTTTGCFEKPPPGNGPRRSANPACFRMSWRIAMKPAPRVGTGQGSAAYQCSHSTRRLVRRSAGAFAGHGVRRISTRYANLQKLTSTQEGADR